MEYEYFFKWDSDEGTFGGAYAFGWAQEWFFKLSPELEEKARSKKDFRYFAAWLDRSGEVLMWMSNCLEVPKREMHWGGCGDYYTGGTVIGTTLAAFRKWLRSKGVDPRKPRKGKKCIFQAPENRKKCKEESK